MHRLERVFNPRSVAVVGSKKVDNYSWLRTVLPFKGPKYHINIDKNEWPGAAELGFPNYSSLLEVPGEVDLVLVSVPAKAVPYVIKDCIAKGVQGVFLHTAGYSETGMSEGIRLEKELVEMARAGGLKVVGPNCLGIFNPQAGIGVNLGGYYGESGHLAFISNSGSQSGGFARGARTHGIKLSKLVSMGNGIILDNPDYLEYFAQDEDTTVIGMYTEGIRNGRRFFNILREVCPKKPVIIWKVGETEDAARAVAAHSTTRNSEAAIWDAMMRQCGAIKADNVDEVLETAKLLLSLPPATGDRLGLLAISGGHATEMTNIFSKAGFKVPALTEASYKRMLENFDLTGSSWRNPIEGRGLRNPLTMNTVFDVLNEDPNVDIIVHEVRVAVDPTGKTTVYSRYGTDLLAQFRQRAKKPYLVAMSNVLPLPPQDATDRVYRELTEAGIPALFGLQGTAKALRKFTDYYQYQRA
ncbi:MAG: CoA-binding protein [Chloroflexi bacterium]|nr:CoA-binding protein [Chloroflexota bacterium]